MKIFGFDTLPSTNTYAVENFDSYENQDIIMAQTQTAGKGRKGRRWSSETGGLYFTIILKPSEIKPEQASSLTQIMAISVCKTIRGLGVSAYLKWPNDVLYKGKKFCGILSEAVTKNNILKGIIIGVGINIEQKNIVSEKPFTSLADIGIKISKSVLLEEIFSNFQTLQKQNFIDEFKKLCPAINTEIIVDGKKGFFEDIDNAGRMILKTEKGREVIMAGDVQF
ncbi:MAG: biotin--[acetyl-CoA-carboxylase] ligase [Elusimicrobiaceae bacterium]|nr:biotin--[acetyl-CoA-carboxylase] ligase [Elusimicrobiaceae bacterium]